MEPDRHPIRFVADSIMSIYSPSPAASRGNAKYASSSTFQLHVGALIDNASTAAHHRTICTGTKHTFVASA